MTWRWREGFPGARSVWKAWAAFLPLMGSGVLVRSLITASGSSSVPAVGASPVEPVLLSVVNGSYSSCKTDLSAYNAWSDERN